MPPAVGGRFTVVRVVIVAVVFMLINKQALMGFGLNRKTPYIAEITATSSDCPVLKFAPGSAIGKTSTIIASGNRAR